MEELNHFLNRWPFFLDLAEMGTQPVRFPRRRHLICVFVRSPILERGRRSIVEGKHTLLPIYNRAI